MRNRVLSMVAAGALLLFAAPAATQAQWVWVGGGLIVPTGDFGDVAKAGWMGTAGVGFPIGESGLGVAAEGFYGQNSADDEVSGFVDGDKFSVYGAMGNVGYRIGDPANVGAYIYGGLGLLALRFSPDTGDSESDSNLGYQFGAGVDIPVGSNIGVFVEGRYMGSTGADEELGESNINLFGVLAGLGFGIG